MNFIRTSFFSMCRCLILDGFGVIENVEPVNGPAPYIFFVTAHDVHAIRAFECTQLTIS